MWYRIKQKLKKKEGFTLMETVLGLLLFTLCMTMISAIFITSSKLQQRAEKAQASVDAVIQKSEVGNELTGDRVAINFEIIGPILLPLELQLVTVSEPTEGGGEVQLHKFVFEP